jgi:sugar phosphate isomerase/epimerase
MKYFSRLKIGYAAIVFLFIALFTQCNDGTDAAPESAEATTADTGSAQITDNWKLGVQLWTFRLFTVAQALDKVDSAGVKNIEAFWGQPLGAGMKDSFGIRMSAESKTKLKNLLKEKGISMVAMGVISPATREEWQQAFDLAKDFGLQYITAEPRKSQWDMVDSLAGAYGIKIAIHDHPKPNAYWHPDSVLAAIQGHSNIGACADIGHWARNGLDPVECLKKLEGHVYGVHLKDITVFGQTHAADTIVGRGVINFHPIFAELAHQQFRGMLSIEHESNWLHSLPDVIETVGYYHKQIDSLR